MTIHKRRLQSGGRVVFTFRTRKKEGRLFIYADVEHFDAKNLKIFSKIMMYQHSDVGAGDAAASFSKFF